MITGATRLAALIGDPVRHSLSPAIHNAGFAALELDWVFVALPVAAGGGSDAIDAMRLLGLDGLSVTMPHKAAAAAAADEQTEVVRTLGVSNCLYRKDGRIIADSTDGDGFVSAYESAFGSTLADARVVVVGAGGAARAIVEAVSRSRPASLTIVNRTQQAAVQLLELAPDADIAAPDDLAAISAADVIVNATSVGMGGGPDPMGIPVPVEALHGRQSVIDIVYEPRMTPLLIAAADRGAAVANGVGMLVHQAALAFERWTGRSAPIAAMQQVVDAEHTPGSPG